MLKSAANDVEMALNEAEAADRARAFDDIALLMWRFNISVTDLEAYCATLPPERAPRLRTSEIKTFVPYFGG